LSKNTPFLCVPLNANELQLLPFPEEGGAEMSEIVCAALHVQTGDRHTSHYRLVVYTHCGYTCVQTPYESEFSI